ncbi:MAG: arylsulfatase [Pseudomonadota bacterium]
MQGLSKVALFAATFWVLTVQAQPNVLLILADDLGWNDVGFHGSEIRTPNLDSLALTGVVLNQYHSQPTCSPTRAALMTGKSPQRLGIYQQFAKYATQGLPVQEKTLGDYLQTLGYQTWLIGKWHLGYAKRVFHPNSRGFDHFYGHVTGGIGYWDHVHGGGYDWQRNGTTVRDQGYATHLLAKEAVDLIKKRDDKRPFFLFASFNAPHLPNEAPAPAISEYAHIDNPFRRIHAAMVTELDRSVGQIIQALKAEGEYENTLIWFMSDNGGLNREASLGPVSLSENLQGMFGKPLPIKILEFIRTNTLDGGSDNTPLRYGKGSVYEGGTRVPSFTHWPGQLPAHRTDEFVTAQDVLPTILNLIGAGYPDELDGSSRRSALLNQPSSAPNDYVTISQYGDQAYYRWPWKLISMGDRVELYNLIDDPLETKSLADQETHLVEDLKNQLDTIPRAPSLHIPLYKVLWDPDFFGGKEDRPPWAERTVLDSTRPSSTSNSGAIQ